MRLQTKSVMVSNLTHTPDSHGSLRALQLRPEQCEGAGEWACARGPQTRDRVPGAKSSVARFLERRPESLTPAEQRGGNTQLCARADVRAKSQGHDLTLDVTPTVDLPPRQSRPSSQSERD